MDERCNPSKDVGLYIYNRDVDIRNYACEIPSFSISLFLFVRRLINGIQNHITNERSSIMREGFDERIDSPLSLSIVCRR